jgi:hypothetical protein
LHEEAHSCMYCHRRFGENRKKVADHNHLTGDYRGAACNNCNLMMKLPKHIVIMFHNMKGYDGHFIVRCIMQLVTKYGDHVVNVDGTNPKHIRDLQFQPIKESGEKYMMIRFGPLQFIDSFSYLQTSLDKAIKAQKTLVGATVETLEEAFPQLAEFHDYAQPDQDYILDGPLTKEKCLDLLTRKNKMPFEAMQDERVFDRPPVLEQSAYNSKLSQETCTDADYTFIHKVANTLCMESFHDYINCYQQTDVLALADIMEAVRTSFHQQFRCDPVHKAFTLPSAAQQAMKYMTRVKIEHITTENGGWELYNEIDESLMGGLSCIFQPYAKANNKHCKDYDETAVDSHIVYIDANSLYPYVMTLPLPVGGYTKINMCEDQGARRALLQQFFDAREHEKKHWGYLVKCDFHVPEELHDRFDWAPVARMCVPEECISNYSKELYQTFNKDGGVGTPKLVPFLGEQEGVSLCIDYLLLLVKLGLRITRVRKIFRFRVQAFMKDWIEELGEERALSVCPVRKQVIKITLVAQWGKFCQRKDKYSNTRVYVTPKQFEKAVSGNRVLDFTLEEVCADSFFASVSTCPVSGIILDTPRLCAKSVLDTARQHMICAHYNCISQIWQNARLLFTDTDSLIYLVKSSDIVDDMLQANAMLDLPIKFDLNECGIRALKNFLEHFEMSEGDDEKYIAKAVRERTSAARICADVQGKVQSGAWRAVNTPEYDLGPYDALMQFKGVLGALKDETLPAHISEYVGLCAKMYSYLKVDKGKESSESKAKGAPKAALKSQLTHEIYRRTLFENHIQPIHFQRIASKRHKTHIMECSKKGLSCYNDKVFQLSALESRPLGHYLNSGYVAVTSEEPFEWTELLNKTSSEIDSRVIELEYDPFADVE